MKAEFFVQALKEPTLYSLTTGRRVSFFENENTSKINPLATEQKNIRDFPTEPGLTGSKRATFIPLGPKTGADVMAKDRS